MQAVKRLEVITTSHRLPDVVAAIESFGLSGYTVFHDVTGKGHRGLNLGDDLTDVFRNCVLVTTCTSEQLPALVEAIRPILKAGGGVCLVSDANWVIH